MTEEEIRRDVRLSIDSKRQIRILADINLVSEDVIDRIANGETWKEALQSTRVPPENRWKAWSKKELVRAAALKRRGMTVAQIAEKFGRTASGVRGAIDAHPEMFGERAAYRRFTEEDGRIARECWARGERLCDIARRLDRAAPTVRRYLMREGLYPAKQEKAAHGGGAS